ncbi:hypothetical protein L0Z25_29570 [Burkholderia multivorans]|uniref:hypothetical protein n=1 Tax=Burkholderia multivorans TaxID=87883 RepID=UPI00207CA2F2|nr:hypothetical protein [Burkholderia multivorans]MCO1363002.1 hypothetical protein [Burkholderia multivorans]
MCVDFLEVLVSSGRDHLQTLNSLRRKPLLALTAPHAFELGFGLGQDRIDVGLRLPGPVGGRLDMPIDTREVVRLIRLRRGSCEIPGGHRVVDVSNGWWMADTPSASVVLPRRLLGETVLAIV